jgi:hypothetical protein
MNDPHEPAVDQLTIARLMVLTAGIGVGLAVFAPPYESFDAMDSEHWRKLATSVLIGVSLPGVFYNVRRRSRRVATGGLLWLTLSLGVWILLPPAIAAPLLNGGTKGDTSAGMCLYFVLPLVSVWFLLAAWLGGKLQRRHFSKGSAWGDRFGVYLGLVWSILGTWVIFDFYWEAFSGLKDLLFR